MLHLEKCFFCNAENAYYDESLVVEEGVEKKVIEELMGVEKVGKVKMNTFNS